MNAAEVCSLVFEPIREEHLGRIMPIEKEAYPEAWSENMFRQEVGNPGSHFCVVLREGDLIGYCGFWVVMDEAHITSVTVRRDCRRNGYGRLQVQYLLDAADDLGLTRAILEVRESNQPARNLYESMGFETIGRRKGYYPKTREDALVMVRRIRPPASGPAIPFPPG